MIKFLKGWWLPIVVGLIVFIYGFRIIKTISLTFIDIYSEYFFQPGKLNPTTTAQIGDTFGGTTGPYIALIASFLTFIAFWVQFKANEEVRQQFKIQQFESQFYEMLRLHKENITEMKIVGYESINETSILKDKKGKIINTTETRTVGTRITEGRKVFVTMSTELIACYEILEYYNDLWKTRVRTNHLLELAYKFFFFGSKSNIVSSEHIENTLIEKFRDELNKVRSLHKKSYGIKNKVIGLNNKTIKLYIKYLPFSGHENRLGHYYRHLYSTVKYVVSNEQKGLFAYNKSREYLKMLRSQMSNDEQLMLYYNYAIGFGKDWENLGFLTKYRMLHNLPINKVKYAQDPRTHFIKFINLKNNKEGNLFEWGDEEK